MSTSSWLITGKKKTKTKKKKKARKSELPQLKKPGAKKKKKEGRVNHSSNTNVKVILIQKTPSSLYQLFPESTASTKISVPSFFFWPRWMFRQMSQQNRKSVNNWNDSYACTCEPLDSCERKLRDSKVRSEARWSHATLPEFFFEHKFSGLSPFVIKDTYRKKRQDWRGLVGGRPSVWEIGGAKRLSSVRRGGRLFPLFSLFLLWIQLWLRFGEWGRSRRGIWEPAGSRPHRRRGAINGLEWWLWVANSKETAVVEHVRSVNMWATLLLCSNTRIRARMCDWDRFKNGRGKRPYCDESQERKVRGFFFIFSKFLANLYILFSLLVWHRGRRGHSWPWS